MDSIIGLFAQKWKIIFAIIVVVSITFLDKIIPPFGIPIAVILIFALFRVRKVGIENLGLFKPVNVWKTITIGIMAGITIPAFGIFILTPVRELFGMAQENPEMYAAIEGNNAQLLIFLIVSWTTAGFGEELIFRSFFMGQLSTAIEDRKYKWTITLVISSLIFGLLHFNNGVEAIIGTTVSGFILGLVYLITDRNIWASYIAHGVADTIAFLIIYTGWYHVL
jgi:membrane protease YdiL (CAAX protease family)